MIRLATEEDYPNIIRMAREFHKISPYSELPFSESECAAFFKIAMNDLKNYVILCFDHGMLIGMKSKASFSTAAVTTELAWWVDPDFRRSRLSLSLIDAYIDWSVRVGAKVTQMAMLDDVTDLDKFYRHKGFTPAERSYIRINT